MDEPVDSDAAYASRLAEFLLEHIGEPYTAYEVGQVLELRPVGNRVKDLEDRVATLEQCLVEIERKLGLRRRGLEPPVPPAPLPVTISAEPRRRFWNRRSDEDVWVS